jgi:serine/threonine protein kinase
MAPPQPPEPAPIDRYVVLEYLAEGGMGAIYLGKRMGAGGFEKQVVLKQLLPEFTRQPEFIELFLREARLSATLDHANIIHTIDLVTAGEDYFIVMEFLDGADLRTLLRRAKRRRRKVNAAAGIYVARELLSALAYAHNKLGPDGMPLRLIHRDISPSNILVSGSGEVKLTDFGIAKASTHNSMFYRVKGKVGYMSPEQAHSDPLDARSDLYSLAVCLYEMITGERLFLNVGITTSAEQMYSQPVPLVSHKVSGLPPELDKVMLKALSRDPDHRYQTAGEFQEALLRCAHRHGLMMSAPELAEHLREVCGDPETWRDEQVEATRAGGTELYDLDEGNGTEQIDLGDDSEAILSDSDVVSMASGNSMVAGKAQRRERAKTSITRLTELKGIELTSLINMGGGADDAGAAPLVDFNDLARSPNLSGGAPAQPISDDDSHGYAFGSPGTPVPRRDAPGRIETLGPDDGAPAAARSGQAAFARDDSTGIVVARGPRRDELGRSTAPVRPSTPPPTAAAAPSAGGRPWLVLTVIFLVGIGTAVAIGLSGPTLPEAPARPSGAAGTPAVGASGTPAVGADSDGDKAAAATGEAAGKAASGATPGAGSAAAPAAAGDTEAPTSPDTAR